MADIFNDSLFLGELKMNVPWAERVLFAPRAYNVVYPPNDNRSIFEAWTPCRAEAENNLLLYSALERWCYAAAMIMSRRIYRENDSVLRQRIKHTEAAYQWKSYPFYVRASFLCRNCRSVHVPDATKKRLKTKWRPNIWIDEREKRNRNIHSLLIALVTLFHSYIKRIGCVTQSRRVVCCYVAKYIIFCVLSLRFPSVAQEVHFVSIEHNYYCRRFLAFFFAYRLLFHCAQLSVSFLPIFLTLARSKNTKKKKEKKCRSFTVWLHGQTTKPNQNV